MKDLSVKQEAIAFLQGKEAKNQTVDWKEVITKFDIRPKEIFSNVSKYTNTYFVGEKKVKECCVYSISNGNAWDCPAYCRNACNIKCYGFKGNYVRYSSPKINKEFQRLVVKFAPVEWLFEVSRHLATNTRMKKENRLRFIRLNEVSDFDQPMLDKAIDWADMLHSDAKTRHTRMFAYTKQNGAVDFSQVGEVPNFCINASQTINPLYEGGNCFWCVSKEFYDSVEETEQIRKCNCDIACVDACGICYEDNDCITVEKFH